MKKIFTLAICVLLCAACTKKKPYNAQQNPYLRPVTMELSAQDTLDIRQLVNTYMDAFSNNDFETASQMLYFVRNDSVLPLTDKDRTEFVQAMKHFTVYGCEMVGFSLQTEKNNEVRLAVQIMEDGDLATERGITHFSLNPVRKDGQWYLTVLDKDAEGVVDYYQQ